MTADEFRKILDRFHQELTVAGAWALNHAPESVDTPSWYDELDAVWRDLHRECALMADAERRTITTKAAEATPKGAVNMARSRVLRNSSIPMNP